MRKTTIILFTIGFLTFLTACNNAQLEDNEGNTEEQPINTDSKLKDDSEDALSNEEQLLNEDTISNIDIIDFEEAFLIEQEIDISELEVDIETDNRNKRILLFLHDNEPIYKTIYIKYDKRLKIINIRDDQQQIFNEIIE